MDYATKVGVWRFVKCINCYKMIDYSLLAQCPVFRGISEDECKMLLSKIHFQIKKFQKDEVVVMAGDPVANLLIVLSGSVRGEMIDYSGKDSKD